MPQGIITKLIEDRGFGFIKADEGYDRFFHHTGCDDFNELFVGDRVTFTEKIRDDKPVAIGVRQITEDANGNAAD
jgi:cold shock CspA family protein